MKALIILALCFLAIPLSAQENPDYFLPEGTNYKSDIPAPEEVLGFQPGEFHITYGQLLRYIEILAEKSDRVSFEITGYTHENQPLVLVSFTSPDNQVRLDKLRDDHLASIDPLSNPNRIREEPLIVWLGYSIHGNEASGVNAAPLVAYYLAASEDEELLKMLDETIILMDPCLNPDGVNRFASWVNSHKSYNNVSDPNSIEFSEAWPGSRSNHYWFDLNRDWMFLQQPESRARIAAFHRWKPHVLTDHHEMGSNSTFFFQPGVPARANPIVPASNFSITQKLGTWHARELDEIGSLYYSEEVFDDYYFGKGSAYPDVNGGIGILFEQAATRGHLRESQYGLMPFSFAIRNQVKASFSTLLGSWNIRKELIFHQKDFFKTALEESSRSNIKGYVFGCPDDPQRTGMMIDILSRHKIDIYPLKSDFSNGEINLPAGEGFFIPAEQVQYRMIRALMEKVTTFADSTFYDISTWTLPLAMGVQYAEIDDRAMDRIKTDKVLSDHPFREGALLGNIPKTGYLFSIAPYLAPKAIYELQKKGLFLKIGTEPFSWFDGQKNIDFPAGTVFVPVQPQGLTGDELHRFMGTTARMNGLEIFSVNTSYTPDGPDLGSGAFRLLEKPKIIMLTGSGMSSSYTGQIWFLLDTRFSIPVTLADNDRFGSIDLSGYNTLILTGRPDKSAEEKLKDWIRGGGKIIALGSANAYLRSAGIIDYSEVEADKSEKEDEPAIKPYADRRRDYAGQSIPGSIFEAQLDLTHPLAYGYSSSTIPVFKRSTEFIAPSKNPYVNPVYFTEDPLMSGFINDENLEMLKGSVSVMTHSYGRGGVISFFDDPTFRAYFAGLHKLFMNAIILGGAI